MARQLSRAPQFPPSRRSTSVALVDFIPYSHAYTYGLLPISPDHRRESSVFEREWWTLGRAAGRVEPCRQFQNVRDRAYWLTGSVHQTQITIPAITHPSVDADQRLSEAVPSARGSTIWVFFSLTGIDVAAGAFTVSPKRPIGRFREGPRKRSPRWWARRARA